MRESREDSRAKTTSQTENYNATLTIYENTRIENVIMPVIV